MMKVVSTPIGTLAYAICDATNWIVDSDPTNIQHLDNSPYAILSLRQWTSAHFSSEETLHHPIKHCSLELRIFSVVYKVCRSEKGLYILFSNYI
jgi:hypothetical protein